MTLENSQSNRIWEKFISPDKVVSKLMNELEALDTNQPGSIMQLRKQYDAEMIQAGINLTNARKKAKLKFDKPDELLADVEGVEQATSYDIAKHKAKRFRDAGITHVMDLCCGIGGDAIGLAEVIESAKIIVVDKDPVRVQMARHNVNVTTGKEIEGEVGDVTEVDIQRDWGIHLDPARREGARRTHAYEDYQPGPAFINKIVGACDHVCVKLGPGIDFDELPEGEVELISRYGTLVQAVLWTGRFSGGGRSATKFPEGVTISGESDWPPMGASPKSGDYLYVVDPAVERAQLMHVLCHEFDLWSPHPQLGVLIGKVKIESPWLRGFKVLDAMSWREKKVKEALKSYNAGIVTIKTRGVQVNPDEMQKRLRGKGDIALTVFIQRVGKKQVAWICSITDEK